MEGFPKTVFITGSSAGFGAFMAHALHARDMSSIARKAKGVSAW